MQRASLVAVALVLLAPTAVSYMMASSMKPRRTDRFYMGILYSHFVIFVVGGFLFAGIGALRHSLPYLCIPCFLALPFFGFVIKLALRVRLLIAALADSTLSDYLCKTVLIRGLASIGPMIFFR